jgi:DNA-binding transcriptional ArsR family regulator
MDENEDKKLAKWTENFKLVGSPVRLMILLAIYASDIMKRPNHSLSYSEINNILGTANKDTLAHHLKLLEEANFIKKVPAMENGRVFPVYKAGDEGQKFLESTGLTKLFQDKLKQLAAN